MSFIKLRRTQYMRKSGKDNFLGFCEYVRINHGGSDRHV